MAEDWLLGIEVGGTKLQLGIGRADGSLQALERLQVDPNRGAPAILDQIRQGSLSLLQRSRLPAGKIRGVGVGFGGPVDVARGRVQTSYQVPGWTDFPLADWLRQNLGVACIVIQNDADTAGLAEARIGAGAGYSPLLYITIGSGIGGALIIDGQIYRGAGKGAAEIGHLELPDRTRPGEPIVSLEAVASGWGIARQARREAENLLRKGPGDWIVLERSHGDPRNITAEQVAQASKEGDPLALAVLDQAHQALAFALRQAVALVAPRRIILGGGVSLIGDAHWFSPIRRLVDEAVFPPFRGSFDIVPAALGEEVVVHGALALARDAASQDS
jgi:glucokinase